MINLLSESKYIAQTNKIKTAITNKVNAIKASFTRIGAKVGATINWLDDIESTLDDELTEINTELLDKGSTQADDFSEVAEKISDIETGITPSGTVSITQNGTVDVTQYASASVAVPNDIIGYVNGSMTEFVNDEIQSIKDYCFFNESTLKVVNLQNATSLGAQAFRGSDSIKKIFLKKMSVPYNGSFRASTKLGVCDILGGDIRGNAFDGCTAFKSLVVRKTGSIVTLSYPNAFASTPFRNGTGGTVYVPYSLVSTYEGATNWSGLESTTFSAIQEKLVALNALGIDITDYYEIVTVLPTSDIATDIVYFIETQTAGIYEQWFYGSGSWVQLADITLGGSV